MKYFIFLLITLILSGFTSISGQNNPYLTLPDSSVTYIYNLSGDSIPATKTYRSIKGDKTTVTTVGFEGIDWKNKTQVIFISGVLSSKEFSYSWSGTAWQPETLITKQFDDQYISEICTYFSSEKSNDWIPDSRTTYFRNVNYGVDSVYTYILNSDSTDLNLTSKEYRTNCYDRPIQSVQYTKDKNNTWIITGKTEYKYSEEDHDETATHYSFSTDFTPEKKVYTDYDNTGEPAFRQEFSWQPDKKNWSGAKLFVRKAPNRFLSELTQYRFDGQTWIEASKTVRHMDSGMHVSVIENLVWTDSLTLWTMNTKTFNEQTTRTITKNNTVMDEQVYLADRSIIIQNEKYSQSSYSLYSLGGLLLQRGTIAQNHIDIDPKIQEQTLVLILMCHSAIFSKKLHFMQ
ncbi:hypothetical protein [Saccharicrinis sp. FJH54]|uniref:hypothetical protein n=1 Tax=Saccharicrinis sp. FJH54 TaxID=3344665 RepID=UPI0035D468EA